MQQACLTRAQRVDSQSLMNNPEAALCMPTNELSFYITVEKTQSSMSQPSWVAALGDKVAVVQGKVLQAHGEDAREISRGDFGDSPEDRPIGNESNAALRQLVAEELEQS